MTGYFAKTGANSWDIYTYDGTTYTAAGAGIPITFDATTGALATVNGAAGTSFVANGITFDLAGTTQFGIPSTLSSSVQDGYPAGSLVKVTVDEQGYVRALYSNGQTASVAQVALAGFPSADGLEKIAGTLFQETLNSGSAIVVTTNNESDKIIANALEKSNVDLADQLVRMITTQRAYSASSKTITTSDELLQETLNLKR
jgi:flagellar hook protein FlgE